MTKNYYYFIKTFNVLFEYNLSNSFFVIVLSIAVFFAQA